MKAVSAPHHLATEAGHRVLSEGGNAVDAAIAVVAAQGVVAPETCGLGGDLFALVHQPGWDRPKTLNSSGHSGSNIDASRLRDAGLTSIPLDHPTVASIPGGVDGLVTLCDKLGSKDLHSLLTPAIDLASGGFTVSDELAGSFLRQADRYRQNLAVSDFFPSGIPVAKGSRVTREDLAATLADLATSGDRNTFYLGQAGTDIIEAVDGLITTDDLARSQAEWIDPLGVEVFGHTAWTTPPNSQGYLGPASLAVFEMLDPPDDTDDPMWWHLLIESYRCLAWERDDLVSDIRFGRLDPDEMVSRMRLESLSKTIQPTSGVWPASMGGLGSTAYMCTADDDGMLVSIIQSNYRGLGSPFGAARSGFLLQDRGLGFNLIPGHPNELGPGKRPLHTLSPTLWTHGDQPAWSIGTRGGDIQPQLVAQMAARVVRGGQDVGTAQGSPRWSMTDFGPGTGSQLMCEPGLSETVVNDLRARGHQIQVTEKPQPGWGPMSVIGVDGDHRHTARDPRVETTAAIAF